ncbi:MAG: gluconate 2-dehydrogenase subunit 3 family protein [Acidobacteria bacterium]|nr:gluconate 2-dehydrogenase subunit 3 family protein [Acidobacteriota bacterium]
MSKLVQLEGIGRREIVRGLALALTSAGSLDLEAAQHVHTETAADKKKTGGVYKPKALTDHEYKTVSRLAELIVPADEVSGSGVDAGAPEFIDLLASQNAKLADIYHGGLAWLDAEMRRRNKTTFLAAAPAAQTGMLDVLVAAEREERTRRGEELVYQRSADYRNFAGYTTKRPGEFGPGVVFFDWVRRMTVDAFYTSPMGVKDIGYVGNRSYSKYEVPQAALDYAIKRSPFANG